MKVVLIFSLNQRRPAKAINVGVTTQLGTKGSCAGSIDQCFVTDKNERMRLLDRRACYYSSEEQAIRVHHVRERDSHRIVDALEGGIGSTGANNGVQYLEGNHGTVSLNIGETESSSRHVCLPTTDGL